MIYDRSGIRVTAEEAERNDRQDQAALFAIEVWGNYDDAMLWLYQPTGLFGGWVTPAAKAREGVAGLQSVLALLASMKAAMRPSLPKLKPRGRRRKKKPVTED